MILALDSSSSSGSAALVEAGRLLRELTFAGGRSRGGGAAAALEELAAEAAIVGVVVGTGPGSYSGIRTAIAVAWGFAVARGVPLWSASSLLALAPGEYLAAGDARQHHFYLAHVKDSCFLRPPRLVDAATLQGEVRRFPALPVLAPSPLESVCPGALIAHPKAGLLASFATLGTTHPETPPLPEPIYLKPPSITPPRSKTASHPPRAS